METKIELNEVVIDWLKRAESKNTKMNYQKVLKTFSEMTFKLGHAEEMNEGHWSNLKPSDVRNNYIEPLQKEGLQNSTIKYYIRVVGAFVTHMERYKEFNGVDTAYIKTACLETKTISDDTVSRSKLGASEYYEFVEWLQDERFEGKNVELGYKYALAAEFMFKTASRLTAVFKHVKWSDLIWEGDSYHNYGWTAYILDKGRKMNKKVIPTSLYEKLYDSFFEGDNSKPVFDDLSSQVFSRLMREYGESVGKDYTPHSLKVGAGTEVYNRTKDLVRTMEFLDHSDPKTTLKYIRLDDDRTKKGGYILSLDVNKDRLSELTKEQLMSIIASDSAMSMAVAREAEERCYADNLIVEK